MTGSKSKRSAYYSGAYFRCGIAMSKTASSSTYSQSGVSMANFFSMCFKAHEIQFLQVARSALWSVIILIQVYDIFNSNQCRQLKRWSLEEICRQMVPPHIFMVSV